MQLLSPYISGQMLATDKVQGMWTENCQNCHVPMYQVQMEGERLEGIPDSVCWRPLPKNWEAWKNNPVVQQFGEFWYCKECKSIWTKAIGLWTKVKQVISSESETYVSFGYKETFEFEIPIVETILPPHLALAAKAAKVDKTTPPYPHASLCPQCHTWRKQFKDDKGNVWHKCEDCGSGEPMYHLNALVTNRLDCKGETDPNKLPERLEKSRPSHLSPSDMLG